MNRPINTSFAHEMLKEITAIGKVASKQQDRNISFSTAAKRVMEQGILAISLMSNEDFNELMRNRS